METTKHVYLISDSTGELGERFINALMSQFPKGMFVFKKFNFVANENILEKIFEQMESQNSILFHTVMSKSLKQKITLLSTHKKIHEFDLTGPPTDFIARFLNVIPLENVSALHRMDDAYGKRIDAIEYTMDHDDGAKTAHLEKADIVLLGPSRSSKTPTSVYLAVKGYCVANVPLIHTMDIHEGVKALKGNPKVIGFVIKPEKLCEMRMKRVSELNMGATAYTDIEEVRKEVLWCRRLYQAYEWKTIDVTGRAIEETATLIIKHIHENGMT